MTTDSKPAGIPTDKPKRPQSEFFDEYEQFESDAKTAEEMLSAAKQGQSDTILALVTEHPGVNFSRKGKVLVPMKRKDTHFFKGEPKAVTRSVVDADE